MNHHYDYALCLRIPDYRIVVSVIEQSVDSETELKHLHFSFRHDAVEIHHSFKPVTLTSKAKSLAIIH